MDMNFLSNLMIAMISSGLTAVVMSCIYIEKINTLKELNKIIMQVSIKGIEDVINEMEKREHEQVNEQ